MLKWKTLQRVFLLGAGSVLFLHFTMLFFFIREQLSRANSLNSDSHNLPYIRDERSPLETNLNTDWGKDFNHNPRLGRHLEYNTAGIERNILGNEGTLGDDNDDEGKGNTAKKDERYKCLGDMAPSEDNEEPLQWQEVADGQALVFSAYLDPEPYEMNKDRNLTRNKNNKGKSKARIVVIGLAGPRVIEELKFHCQIWYRKDGDQYLVVEATAIRLDKNTINIGSDVFFYCEVNPDQDPMAVSIVNLKECANVPPNLLIIRNIDEAQSRTRPVNNFTVCIHPLRHRFDDARTLVETAELNFLLGSNRIVFYDQDTTDRVKGYYESYKSDDLATVIPWELFPITQQNNISTSLPQDYARLSALNDCLYRFRFASRYIAFLDIEEFIVPEIVKNWNDLLMKLYRPGVNAFAFSRVPFPDSRGAYVNFAAAAPEVRYHLLSQLNTKRMQPLPPGDRSGFMVVPTQVDIVGLHDAILQRKGGTLDVESKDASLRDYSSHQTIEGAHVVEDKRTLIYNDALKRRVAERHALVRGKA